MPCSSHLGLCWGAETVSQSFQWVVLCCERRDTKSGSLHQGTEVTIVTKMFPICRSLDIVNLVTLEVSILNVTTSWTVLWGLVEQMQAGCCVPNIRLWYNLLNDQVSCHSPLYHDGVVRTVLTMGIGHFSRFLTFSEFVLWKVFFLLYRKKGHCRDHILPEDWHVENTWTYLVGRATYRRQFLWRGLHKKGETHTHSDWWQSEALPEGRHRVYRQENWAVENRSYGITKRESAHIQAHLKRGIQWVMGLVVKRGVNCIQNYMKKTFSTALLL